MILMVTIIRVINMISKSRVIGVITIGRVIGVFSLTGRRTLAISNGNSGPTITA